MRAARRHLSTVTVAAATAVVTATVITGGPALAASVVAYAKNAGAVDGRHAVANTASVAARRGQLVATGARSGQLPNDIIARAPDSARLQGIPLSGLAGSAIFAHGFWSPSTDLKSFCRTAAYTPATDSFATIVVDADAFTTGPATTLVVHPAVSTDGGATFAPTRPNWYLATAVPTHSYGSVSNVATVALVRGRHYAFAGVGNTSSATPIAGDCTLDVQIVPRLPGSRVIAPDAQAASTSTGRPAPAAAGRH